MNKNKFRYSIASQMQEYDRIKENWIPFLMFMQRPNHRSKIVNTDINGLRFNTLEKEEECIFNSEPVKNIIVGSSSVFGVGATKDEFTIPSKLSKKKGEKFLNFGGRAFSGLQEILLFLKFINKLNFLKEVIIISGINDFFLNKQTNHYDYDESLMYNKKKFIYKMNSSSNNFLSAFLDIKNKNERLPKSQKNKQTIMENDIERNILFWSMIKKTFNIKVKFFLQPCATWCKNNLSTEETKIFTELDRYHSNNKIQKSFDENDHELLSNIYKKNCKKYDLEYVNLNDKLKSFDKKENWLFVDRVHLTDQGYEKITEIILS